MANSILEKLLGCWKSDPSDAESIREYGRTSLEFQADGRLIYTIHLADKDQKMLLNFRVEDNVIVTDQPSQPREDRTPFVITDDGRLALSYEDHASRYVRHVES